MRRTALKGALHDIVTSFISRNNDLSGYWGIGKLCLAAKESGTSEIKLDLLNTNSSLNRIEFEAMVRHYREMLQGILVRKSIPASWIAKANIVISFNQENDKRYHFFQSALGEPYICRLELTDDHGKSYSITAGGHCRPHDPSKESRRNPDSG